MFPWQRAAGQGLGCTKGTFNRLGRGQLTRNHVVHGFDRKQLKVLRFAHLNIYELLKGSLPSALTQLHGHLTTGKRRYKLIRHIPGSTLPALDSNMLWQWNEVIQLKMSDGYPLPPVYCFHFLSLNFRVYSFQAICGCVRPNTSDPLPKSVNSRVGSNPSPAGTRCAPLSPSSRQQQQTGRCCHARAAAAGIWSIH